jgi:hypothetical protein
MHAREAASRGESERTAARMVKKTTGSRMSAVLPNGLRIPCDAFAVHGEIDFPLLQSLACR